MTAADRITHIHRPLQRSYQPKGEYDDVIRDGGRGKPDIYGIKEAKNQLDIFSIKCVKIDRNSLSLPIEEFKPEILFARENRAKFTDIKVYAVIYDHYNEIEYRKEIDFISPAKTILVKKKKKS